MWTWRRKEPGTPPEGPSPATLPVTRAEWRSLPPIQRVVAGHPLINPVQRFSSSLASWRSPAYLEPLGHLVGPAEPSGVIDGLARAPVPPPDMPVVHRSARKRGVLSRLWGTSVQRAAEPDTPVSVITEPDAPVSAVAHDEPARAFEPTAAVEPTAVLVLPALAASSREADRPPMPLTSVGPSVVSARPPVRTVQAIRSETPGAPLPAPEPASALAPGPSPMAPEPEPVGVENVPVPLASEVATPRPVEPSLPVVQRTEQAEAAPRRLGLGAPILPDPVQAEAPVVSEDDIAEVEAPLAGDVETSVLPTVPAGSVPDEAPRPVARMAGAESKPPAMSVETPSESRASLPVAVQSSVVESARGLPSPESRDVSRAGGPAREPVQRVQDEVVSVRRPVDRLRDASLGDSAPVQRVRDDMVSVQRLRDESPVESAPVQRLRDEPPVESAPVQGLPDESPGERPSVQRTLRDESPSVRRPVQRLRDEAQGEPPSVQRPVRRSRDESPGGPTPVQRPGQRLRDEPRPVQRLRDESPREPLATLENTLLPVSRAVEPPPSLPAVTSSRSSPGTTFHSPGPPRIRSGTTGIPEPPGTPGGSVSAPPAPVISTSPLPVARAVDGPAATSSAPAVADQRPTLTALRIDHGVAPLPEPPVSRVIESPLPSARVVPETRTAKAVVQLKSHQPTTTLPVARNPEPPSTMDFPRTVQRSVSGEAAPDSNGLVLNLPSVVVPRQPETPVVQREPETPPPPEPVAPPPAAPVPAMAAPAAQPETEELVKKLFDPLLRRLKTELRLDRERRGALTDRPH
ncbi:hypothetical protein [Amycolatopsis keratiniphila]|uniref:hypothetical protein n=1 Tax=Amycolatopsis keratiniphila TaxID=129921 RepID=UPI00087C6407|nr:hypothetical protein [Amycolatopsis keratiniphila]SDU26799.1 hypothetical protein SAMN04489733_2557 [Amycolatopsis keratiniphila]